MTLSDDVKALIADIADDFRNTPQAVDDKVLATLFEPIVGFDDVKDLLRRAVLAAKPVHVLLEGPPASAKTLFLMELGRLPEAHFVVGGTASRAGLAELLVMWRPRFLLVDEIETIARMKDYGVLLHLMESQEVVITKHGKRIRIPLTTQVVAAGNDSRRLPRALVSRFGGPESILRLRAYRREEFIEVCAKVLTERERVARGFAEACALAAAEAGSRDVRYAVRLARLARNEADLDPVLRAFGRRR
jgi:Holliday junction DNA helicase RuvB